ncbi:FtsX-like permease family protein [Gemmatimonadota bacterium Y43]|uniref:ABC transporter permease n=1 Tax=Gaopeijia maritima TaxID=3119007 RepID=UPI00327AD196
MMRFPLRLALWEGRATFRTVGGYALSITLGVAALVAVRGFRADVERSVESQARVLLGADAKFESDRPLPDSLRQVVDSLEGVGATSAEVVRTVSMVAADGNGLVRLLQLWSVDGDWPFYGAVEAEPIGSWQFDDPTRVVVDRPALIQLGIEIGDSITIGRARFEVAGSVDRLPTDPGFQSAVGPRVWLSRAALDQAGLLDFGSLARWDTYLRFDDPGVHGIDERYETLLAASGVQYVTATERARSLTRAVDFLGRYLGLVGLGALLLGGIGVGNAIHLFVQRRLTQVAVLRCLGARQAGVFGAYLLQAVALGAGGAVLGVALGMAAQLALPFVLSGVLPVEVRPRPAPATALMGLGVGVWVAVVFALLPLLAIRDVAPLRAFRVAEEGARGRWSFGRLATVGLLGGSVVTLSVMEAPTAGEGVAFALGLGLALGALWLTARAAMWVARRVVPAGAPYPVRQGISNLFRPGNQTVAVTVALGLGAFIVATVLQVQHNLARELDFDRAAGQPDLLLFDVQPDQRRGVVDLLPPDARDSAIPTPLVSARLAAIDGVSVEELSLRDGPEAPEEWALHREYRHSWREALTDAERLVSGAWWPDADEPAEGVARVSVETELADELGVGLGSRLTWSIGGREVESLVTSLREVDWDRFQTNFFVLFEPGAIDDAPATWVVLARVEGADSVAAYQRRLIERYPNVSALDLGHIQEVVDSILSGARRAVVALGGFAALAGVVVLAGALAASRHHRLREGALLKTLGARGGQLLAVFFSEFVALGLVAAATALTLSTLAAWALVARGFGFEFDPVPGLLLSVAAGLVLLTLVTGWLGSRGLLRRPPLPLLRALTD